MLMQTNRLVASLVLVSGILGARWARAQATPQEQAAQRQAEIEQLRAQQEQIKAQLEVLQVEKQRLSRELEQRKVEGAEAQNAAVLKRTLIQREQAIAQVQEEAAKDQQQQAWRKWNADRIARDRAEQNEIPGRAQLDLVSLADRYVDAMGSVKLAEVRMQAMEEKQDKVGIRIEKVNLDTARRKVVIFRGIVEAAREAAQADLDIASQQVKNGLAPVNSVNEAKSRVRILEVILAQ
jgi:hypothetical protein